MNGKGCMKSTNVFCGVIVFGITIALPAQDNDVRPVLKEPQTKLVAVIDSMAVENVIAASINVTHDVAKKRIRIFSIVPSARTGDFTEFGFEVEVIYNSDIASPNVGVGSYHFQHDNQVLSFAAAQFASGNKSLGRWLIEMLAESEPDLAWSIPTHAIMTIRQIRSGIERNDTTIAAFLADKTKDWNASMLHYGPRASKP